MPAGLVTAIRTLTILPIPGKDSKDFSSSLPWFPLTGLLSSILLYSLYYCLYVTAGLTWNDGISLILVFAGTILTGGLHLDGAADFADSLGCFPDKERMLDVMKDSRTGVFGGLALILIVLSKWIALSRLIDFGYMTNLISAYVISRFIMVYLAYRLPYARPENGTAGSIVHNATFLHFVTSLISAAAILYLFSGLAGLILLAFGWLISFLLGIFFKRKYGGITGDLLGTSSEIVETSILFAGAFLAGTLRIIG